MGILILCFNADRYPLNFVDGLKPDNAYSLAQELIKCGDADIFTVSDFINECNRDNTLQLYYRFREVNVEDDEVEKWVK